MLAPPTSHRVCERHSVVALQADGAEVFRTRKRDRVRKALAGVFTPSRRSKDAAPDKTVLSWHDSGIRLGRPAATDSAVVSSYDSGTRLSQPAAGRSSSAQQEAATEMDAATERIVASSDDPGAEQATASEDGSPAALIKSVYSKFEGELQAEELAWLTPEIAAVYVARHTAPADQLQMLSDTVKWRVARRAVLATRECEACAKNPRAHDARIFGVDDDDDVVLMNCFALSRDYTPRGVTDHLACLFERAIDEYEKPARAVGASPSPDSPGSPDARLRWTWVTRLQTVRP